MFSNIPDMAESNKFLGGLLLGALAGAALTYFLQTEKGKAFVGKLKEDAADLEEDLHQTWENSEAKLKEMLAKAEQKIKDLESRVEQA